MSDSKIIDIFSRKPKSINKESNKLVDALTALYDAPIKENDDRTKEEEKTTATIINNGNKNINIVIKNQLPHLFLILIICIFFGLSVFFSE